MHLSLLSNDLGFRKGRDGRFVAIVSDYDRQKFDAAWLKRLTQRYAYHVTRETLSQQGFDLVEENTDPRGTIQLTLRRMGD
jgi:hypothetical protein